MIRSRSRGSMLWMALILLATMSLVITATIGVVRSDIRRTNAEATGSQLRQLLLAGQTAVSAELAKTGTVKDRSLTLPPELRDATASVKVSKATGDRVEATVAASFIGAKAEQTLVYAKRNDKWILESAVLP